MINTTVSATPFTQFAAATRARATANTTQFGWEKKSSINALSDLDIFLGEDRRKTSSSIIRLPDGKYAELWKKGRKRIKVFGIF